MKAIAEQKESETVLKILLYFLKVLLGNESYKVNSFELYYFIKEVRFVKMKQITNLRMVCLLCLKCMNQNLY